MANISSRDLNDTTRLIELSERMDVQGTERIENAFGKLARERRHLVVDLAEVTFLSSVGIRMLIANAKALKESGGKLVLVVGVNAAVSRTLKTTCADALMPMFERMEDGIAALAD